MQLQKHVYQTIMTDNYSTGRTDGSDDVRKVPVQPINSELRFYPYFDPKFGGATYTQVRLVVEILRYVQ